MRSTRTAVLSLCLLSAIGRAQHWVVDLPGSFTFINSLPGNVMLSPPSDDSEQNIFTSIGNAMWPAGVLRIGNNGAVANLLLSPTAGDISPANADILPGVGIPAGLPPGTVAALCPFWDDLDTQINTGIWYQEFGGVLTIMWAFESHFPVVSGQQITFEMKVFAGASGPCSPFVQFLYYDTVFGGTQAGFDHGASATVGYVAGTLGGGLTNAPWSFNSPLTRAFPGLVLSLVQGLGNPAFGAVPSSPSGFGSIRIDVVGAPNFCFSGTYFMPVVLSDTYPKWFFGLGISITELFGQLNTGFPYVGTVGATIGPYTNLPSGLELRLVTIGWASAGPAAPTLIGPALLYTLP